MNCQLMVIWDIAVMTTDWCNAHINLGMISPFEYIYFYQLRLPTLRIIFFIKHLVNDECKIWMLFV